MKICFLFVLLASGAFIYSNAALAQSQESVSKYVDNLNRTIDHAVVNKDFTTLDRHYAEDFVFTHGTGHVDSKESWIQDIQNMGQARFASREHDSTVVEVHNDVAIVSGKLAVVRESGKEVRKYNLRYVRVFALRNKTWQMISHRTTKEWH
jgi:ketosteroid isomerase-like protein